jgi:hypothetical protein
MASYVGQTALTALWNKVVAALAGKADRTSVYSKAEVDYKLATTYGVAGSSTNSTNSSLMMAASPKSVSSTLSLTEESDTSDYVHLSGAETISGIKTFSGLGNLFYSGGIKVRSTSTSYNATIVNTTASNISVYLPTNTSPNQYLLSRQTSGTTANTIPYYTGTNGAMRTKTIATETLSESSNEIPTSAAIISYLRSKGLIS